jgi:hypothetical protein
MDLLAYLSYDTFAPFLGNMLTNILSNRADSGLKQLEALLAAKLQDGQLPANHDLQQAVLDALRQALRSLALALADSHHPASPFLREVRRQLLNPQDRASAVTTLLDVPLWTALDSTERGWIDAFARLIEDSAALSRLAGIGLAAEGGVDALLEAAPPSRRGERLQLAVTEWLDRELHAIPGRPAMLDDYLALGWPVADHPAHQNPLSPEGNTAEFSRIKLFQAWCWFFRESIKERPKVFNIYVAETLTDLKRQLSATRPELAPALAQLPPADLTSFGNYLTAEFADLKHWLETRFDRLGVALDNIRDTQAEHTGLLRKILIEIGGFPQLWRDSRRFRYGLACFALLVSGGLGYLVWQNGEMSEQNAVVIRQNIDSRAKLEEIIAATRQQSASSVSLTPQQRYDQAVLEVAFKHDLKPDELRAAIDAWTHKVKADPNANPYDLALAEYKANHFEQSAAQAGKAYDQAMQSRVQATQDAIKATQDAIKAAHLEGDAHEAQGHYERALVAYRKGADLTDRAKEPLAWAAEQNMVAKMLLALARHQEAEPIQRDILALREQQLGINNPDTSIALNNLAQLLQDTNRLAEAEPLMKRVMAIDEKSYGPEHPNVAIELNNLAQLLQDTNRQAEAEPLMKRVLAIDEKSFGPEHPNVARDLNNLALLLQDTNRLAEAEPLMKRALAIDENNFGPEHPNVAISLNNLAQLLKDTNRLAEAEPLMKRALAIDEKSFGPEHSDVAIDLNNLATLMYATKRLDQAEPLERRAVLILLKSTRAAGHELPNLRTDYANYQALLSALHLNPAAIAQRLESLGPEAGYTPEEWAAVRAGWEQVRVVDVVPGSQAEALGLQAGDVITHYAGEKITSTARLIELTSHTNTPAIPLTILRAGQPITLTAQPGKLGVHLE